MPSTQPQAPVLPDTMLPLADTQAAIWLAEQLSDSGGDYTVAHYLDLDGALQPAVLAQAIGQGLAEAGTVLARFGDDGNGPCQWLPAQPQPQPAERLDLRGERDPLACAQALMQADLVLPLRADGGQPLSRHVLLQVGDTRWYWYQRHHHITIDGYGLSALTRRIAAIYDAGVAGRDCGAAAFSPFAAVLAGQQAYRRSPRHDADAQFWQQQLATLPPALTLSRCDSVASAASAANHTVLRHSVSWQDDTWQMLQQQAALARLQPPQLALAAVLAYLALSHDTRSLAVGVPFMRRMGSAAVSSAGAVVGMLPLALTLDAAQTLNDIAHAAAAALKALRRHQHYPQTALPKRGGASINLKIYEQTPQLHGLTVRQHLLAAGPVDDIEFGIWQSPLGLHLELAAHPARYQADELAAHAQRLQDLLRRWLLRPASSLAGMALCSDAEQQQLAQWEAGPCPARGHGGFAGQLQQLAQQHPTRMALHAGGQSLDFAALQRRVAQLAHLLLAEGVGPGSLVALALARDADSVPAILAVLVCGAAYLPLDPAYPQARLAQLCRDAAPQWLLGARAQLAGLPGRQLLLDDDALQARLAQQPVQLPQPDCHPAQLAYVLYTSGSSGAPKGVMVSHGNLLNLLHAHRHGLFAGVQDGPPRRALHSTAFSFDASWELLLWLLCGQTLYLCDDDTRRDAQAMVELVRRERVDTLDLPPPLLQQMLDCGLFQSGMHQPGLILVGSEAVPPALWQALRAQPQCRIYNCYGPTECTVDALSADLATADSPVIGLPLAHGRAYVLDSRLQRLPPGARGELYLAGAGLARGYLGQPASSAARFVADPFVPGERMYRSGDLVWRRSDGQLVFTGRSDTQLKVRGFRIEAGEIEQALCRLPGVSAAVVLAEAGGGNSRLHGYCTRHGTASGDSLLAQLAAVLPAHMLPSSLTVLTQWPLTDNGKTDRRALPALRTVPARAGRRACNAAEQGLCDSMAAVLGVATVAADDDFFALGGDSISAMALGSRMREAGYLLRPRDVFALRSAERMARQLAPLPQAAPRAGIACGPVGALPVLRWFDQHYGMTRRYAQAVVLPVPAALDDTMLAAALAALQRAHPALAATVAGDSLLLPEQPAAVSRVWRRTADTDADAVLAAAAQRLAPAQGLMWQVVHMQRAGQPLLMLVIHHLVVDGVSWRILLPALRQACLALLAGSTPLLPREDCSLRDWAGVLAANLDARAAELPLWQAMLATPCPLPGRRALNAGDCYGGARQCRTVLDGALGTALLGAVPAACGATQEEVLLALLALAWHEVMALPRLSLSLESHGRQPLDDGHDPARTVGWLTAEYPLALDLAALDGEQSVPAALRAVKRPLRAMADRGLGYGMLRYLDGPHAATLAALEAAGRPPLLFNYLGRFGADDGEWLPCALGGRFADAFAVDIDPAMPLLYALEINVFASDETDGTRLSFNWTWADGVFDHATISALHRALQRHGLALQQLVATQPALAADTLVASQIDTGGQRVLSEAALAHLRRQHGAPAAVLPLLPLQQGLLFHAQLGGAAGNYNSVSRLDFSAMLDAARLQQALAAVLRGYPQLAARFDHDLSLQLIPLPGEPWPWRQCSIAALAPAAQEQALLALERDELARRFDIGAPGCGPLLAAQLVDRGALGCSVLLAAHHLVLDGWSTPLLLQALLQAYRGDSLPAPRVPYAELVGTLARRDAAAARSHWQQALAGVTPTLLFAAAAIGSEVHELRLELPPALDRALHARCREHGLTVNTVLQGAWAALLSVQCGRDDVVFGAPVSGRFAAIDGIEQHIGLFSNTLPVRLTLRHDQPLITQLAALQARQITLLEHDVLGLAEIQRMLGHGTLFDTLLVVENYPDHSTLDALCPAPVRLQSLRNRGHTHYPLTLLALPGTTLTLLLEYRHGVDAPALAQRLLRLLQHLLDAAPQPWGRLSLLSAEEQQLLARSNDTAHPLPALTLCQLLQAQACRTPEAVALLDASCRLDYRSMRGQVRALAQRLTAAGVRPGSVVAVALPRSVRLTLALHAVLEAGAAYLPLDSGYPDQRLAYMAADAAPLLIITDSAQSARFQAMGTLLLFDALADDAALAAANLYRPPQLTPAHGAYLLYTSGSTGLPKPVRVSHRAIVNRLLWMQQQYPLTADDVVLQKTPAGFDVSVWEFFWPHLCGARLLMAPPDAHRDAEALLALIEDGGVSIMHFVPSMLAAFLAQLPARPLRSALRHVFCSGEALPRELAAAWQARLAVPLHNLYGPTEAAVDVSYQCAAQAPDGGSSVPIGLPVWNTRLYILDRALRPLPPGVAGELYLAGVQLADGYPGRPALSAARFVADPFVDGQRMYRSGDIASRLPGGEIVYLGRSDEQLKIRGQRIELGEIEAQLLAAPGVAQAVVLARDNGQAAVAGVDARQLVAYIVAAADVAAPDGEQLRAALARQLPPAMLPQHIMLLPALPLNANGKLDRAALPLPQQQGRRPPAPGLESVLAAEFARVLGRDSVAADDDFFALGGHSLLAMQLAAQLRRLLQRPLALGQLLQMPTVAALAAWLAHDDGAGDAGMAELLPLRAGNGPALFCIHPASGFAWQYRALAAHLPAALPLAGLQSPRPHGALALADSLDALCTRHLATLRAHQPHGPYRLLGYSLGGIVAIALAARLRQQGEQVVFLGLLDASPPELQDWSRTAAGDAEIAQEQAQFMAGDAALHEEKRQLFAQISANYDDAVRLLSQARTSVYPGRAELFVASRSVPAGWDVAASWRQYLADVGLHVLDCSHADMLAPATLPQLGPLLHDLLR